MQVGFGCVKLGSASSGHSWRADVRLVREAVDHGVTLFDTADAYGSGASEAGARTGTGRSTVAGDHRHQGRVPVPPTNARRAVRVAGSPRGSSKRSVSDEPTNAEPRSSGGAYCASRTSRLRICGVPWTRACAACAPTTSTSTSCTDRTRSCPSCWTRCRTSSGTARSAASAWVPRASRRPRRGSPVPGVSVVQLPFGVLDPEAADGTVAGSRGTRCRGLGPRGARRWAPRGQPPRPWLRRPEAAGDPPAAGDRRPSQCRARPAGGRLRAVGPGAVGHARWHQHDRPPPPLPRARSLPGPSTPMLRDEVRAALDQAGAGGG